MKNLRLFLFILAIGVFGILNTEMGVIGILPAVAERFSVPISQAGLLVSLFALVVAGAGPVMPLLFSRFNRKTVMLFVLGLFAVCNLLSAFTDSFAVLLAARIIPAFFHPVYCSLAFAAAAQEAPAGEGPKAVGKVMIGTAAGMVVGVPVSNFLAAQFSLEASLLFFAAVTALAFLATLLWVPSLPVHQVLSYGSQLAVLKKPVVWQAILAVVFMNGAVFGVFSYLADYLDRVTGLNPQNVSLLLLLYGLLSLAGTSASFTALVILLWGILGGINANMNQYWLTTAAPEAAAFANGLFLTAANLGTMAASLLCGQLIDRYGTSFVLSGGVFFAAVSALFIFWRTSQSGTPISVLQKGGNVL